MRPHPRIRKTIKWGGAAVTVLLVVVWIGSGWIALNCPSSLLARDGFCRICDGRAEVGRYDLTILFLSDFGTPNVTISPPNPPGFKWWFGWHSDALGKEFDAPLWPLVLLFLATTMWSRHLDTLDTSARLGLCPKCNYDRAGIGKDAVCPECGARSHPPSPPSVPSV